MNDQEVEDFLAHYGVKGMKWGVRRTRRMQKIVDRHDRIAKGTASKKDRILGANRMVFTAKGAERTLQRAANNQAKINAGKMKATNALAMLGGVRMKDMNYHGRKGDANAKMDSGQKAAVAVVSAYAALTVAGTLARR